MVDVAAPHALAVRSRGPRTRRLALTVAFAGLSAVALPLVLGRSPATSGGSAAGRSAAGPTLAPSFSAGDLRRPDGRVGLLVPPGRPTVVSFFASWCDPCRRELPVLAAAERGAGGRVAFLGVAVRDSRSGALAMLDHAGVAYPAAADPDASVAGRFGLRGMPSTVFVAADGRVLGTVMGGLGTGRLNGWLARLGAR
ncbi:MAG: redoxin domain-containing protein [Actinobacteria bacterium]|nr:MAG: redoxin domain-containing protein [Actinomycetota bacterium]